MNHCEKLMVLHDKAADMKALFDGYAETNADEKWPGCILNGCNHEHKLQGGL